ncbi:hypothetical protein SCH01S_53_00610 [Sphingomonas changbaiensis NBRC 104936]|jgi:hypothetical protein|uniref:Putative zinc-finger domain-containing protein n=1 Tax=Sphingomonas changbaiensis NBRC 104936 TaxID=1219043 RepID=A0A0E9MTV0_9SPHN|nr:zf-HC2 domain-containing protein [Sphingomonas changbaiensis]GAO40989.1 hypothetical protein SCH01S_53_00610 [Sphingomonas changbaiensis NBRC 104936]
MTIDRETIGAFVDGELSEIERRRVEAALADNPVLAQQVEAGRRLRALLKARFDPIAEAPVPERLEHIVRQGTKIVPLPRSSRWATPQWAAIAATLVLGLVLGRQLQPVRDPLLATGPLAQALETQLASAQAPDAPVRIGLTFKARDGAWCRTFEQKTLDGIACRDGGAWRLRQLAAGPAHATEYRQAGSGAIEAAAQDMSTGAPLDAEQERTAVATDWK